VYADWLEDHGTSDRGEFLRLQHRVLSLRHRQKGFSDTCRKLLRLGKGLAPDMTRDMTLLGESLGVIHVAPRDQAFLRATSEWLAGWGQERKAFGYSKARSEHEEAWQYFFAARRMRIAQVPAGLLYTECDTQEDYNFVRDELYPAILVNDSKQP
jgi:hypothetical protein